MGSKREGESKGIEGISHRSWLMGKGDVSLPLSFKTLSL
jgi:hypothetical protein